MTEKESYGYRSYEDPTEFQEFAHLAIEYQQKRMFILHTDGRTEMTNIGMMFWLSAQAEIGNPDYLEKWLEQQGDERLRETLASSWNVMAGRGFELIKFCNTTMPEPPTGCQSVAKDEDGNIIERQDMRMPEDPFEGEW